MLGLLGILHNAAYLLLFERARVDYWRSCGVGLGSESPDWPAQLARNEINYRKAVTTAQEVEVAVWTERIGRSSATFRHEMIGADGVVHADGLCVVVRVDGETGLPIPWSDEFRVRMAPPAL
jgi:acyl-CoA thioester hydrolase